MTPSAIIIREVAEHHGLTVTLNQAKTVDRVSVILKQVAEDYGLSVNDLRGESRLQHIARARQVAYVRLRDETPMSYPAIGRVMGGRDHSTIQYGVREMRKRIKEGLYDAT